MNVRIKQFDVDMEVKTKGIEFEIRTPKGEFLGDFVLTKTQLIWCQGKTTAAKGKKISLIKLIEFMDTQ